ncbi:MAG: TIGR01459 family HAD-type hydrolase, partial [Pseudaminobacter sp.]|nr:TIGR01459 family HAD-type hydrolase [Pseudaminobacter sp.]
MELTAAGVFRRYEEIRPRLPAMPDGVETRTASGLSEIASEFDVFFFDAFGVLNVGDSVIPGAPERIAALRASGKSVFVVTNAATQDRFALQRKYAAMGFDFTQDEIVSSRAILTASLAHVGDVAQWAVMLPDGGSRDGLPSNVLTLDGDTALFWDADGYLFLSSKGWDAQRQERLVARLQKRPCPVLVGNPDLVAPREYGLSKEPGFFAHDILDRTGCAVRFFGKPFGNAFETAIAAASA